jgi:hypothetical protein
MTTANIVVEISVIRELPFPHLRGETEKPFFWEDEDTGGQSESLDQ